MIGILIRRHLTAGLLLAPIALFMILFFLWPLFAMMRTSVVDGTMIAVFPTVAETAQGRSRGTPPTDAMQVALVADIRAAPTQALGDAVRRLNAAHPGFRSLMAKTGTAAKATDGPVDLASVDKRWTQPDTWDAVVDSLPPYTDRFLLAALDLTRADSGSIERVSPSMAVNQLVFGRTFSIAGVVTLLCLLIGYPYAMFAASFVGWKRQAILLAVVIPMWTSVLVRTAAWFILLQDQGVINGALTGIGLIDSPLPLLFNRFAVIVAMVHILLPFMVFPIFNAIVAIPRDLMPAAAAMGAEPFRAFVRVMLPLTLRGIASGSLLVFMTSLGFYILPALLGGAQDQLISSIIAFYAINSADWQMASALGLMLFVVTTVLYYVYGRVSADRGKQT